MFTIEYTISEASKQNLAVAEEIELHYYHFLGSFRISDGHHSIVKDYEWIPIYDFATCFFSMCCHLEKNREGSTRFEFTESDEIIIVTRTNSIVKIYNEDKIIQVSYSDFKEEVIRLFESVFAELSHLNPSMRSNPNVQKWMSEFTEFKLS